MLRRPAVVAALVLVIDGGGCLACNEPGCSSGVEVDIVTSEPVPAGTYVLDVVADDVVLRATCMVEATIEHAECEQELIEGDAEVVDASFFLRGDPGSDGVHGFFVAVGQTHEDGPSIEHTGPRELSIRITQDGEEVFADEREPQYEREHHRGAERCGFCDFAAVEIPWSPPPSE